MLCSIMNIFFKKPIPKNAIIRFLPIPIGFPIIEQEQVEQMEKRWEELKGKCPFCKKDNSSLVQR